MFGCRCMSSDTHKKNTQQVLPLWWWFLVQVIHTWRSFESQYFFLTETFFSLLLLVWSQNNTTITQQAVVRAFLSEKPLNVIISGNHVWNQTNQVGKNSESLTHRVWVKTFAFNAVLCVCFVFVFPDTLWQRHRSEGGLLPHRRGSQQAALQPLHRGPQHRVCAHHRHRGPWGTSQISRMSLCIAKRARSSGYLL